MAEHPPGPLVETAQGLDDTALAELFTLVYTGYALPVHMDAPTMRFMRVALDYDLAASRVLREGGAAVAITLLSRRGDTGWIGGMGVAPSHRGRGLGERVMREVLEAARALGICRVGLEVLVQNEHAFRLYERLGFRTTRKLDVWGFPAPDFADDGPSLEPVAVEEAQEFVRAHRTAPEPWQRADGTVAALRGDGAVFEGLLARRGGRTVGAMVCRVAGRASVIQMATLPGEHAAATRALLASLRRDDAPQGVRWLNLPQDDPAAAYVRSLNPTLEASQHEMELVLG
jgi:GNAT superfamily N-acetyltransferase